MPRLQAACDPNVRPLIHDLSFVPYVIYDHHPENYAYLLFFEETPKLEVLLSI